MRGGGQGVRKREFVAMGAGLFTDVAEEVASGRKGPVHSSL